MCGKLESLYITFINIRQLKSLPLFVVLIVPFTLQLVTTVGIVGYWSFYNGQRNVDELVTHLENRVSQQIQQHLDCDMTAIYRLNEINATTLNSGLLNTKNLNNLAQFFWKQVKLHNIGYILYGSISGEYVDVGRPKTLPYELITEQINPRHYGDSRLYIYEPNAIGYPKKLISIDASYLFQKENWYSQVIKEKKPLWTSVYSWQSLTANPLAVSNSRPVYDRSGNLIGAIAIEKRLDQISNFLHQIKVSPDNKIFIVERNGMMIASSTSAPQFQVINGKPAQIQASDSQDITISTTAKYLLKKLGSFNHVRKKQQIKFEFNRQRYFVQLTPWYDNFGLDWLLVIVIPESDFTRQVNINNRNTVMLCLASLFFSITINICITNKIIQPIMQLHIGAKEIAAGNLKKKVKVQGIRELEILGESFNQMTSRLQQSLKALENANQELELRVKERTKQLAIANQELENLSKTDELTQIANRRGFDNFLNHEWHRLKFEQQPLSLILCDVDHFKKYNDFYGHQQGDRCLKQISFVLRQVVKHPADLIARYGGEEFAIVLPSTTLQGAINVAEKIHQEIHRLKIPHKTSEVSEFITISMGIASLIPSNTVTPKLLFDTADQALYESKHLGRDRYTCANK